MPRQKKTGADETSVAYVTPKRKEYDWGGFINVRLDDNDKALFAQWSEDRAKTMWTDFQELVTKGFKYSYSYQPDTDSHLSTFTAAGKDLIGIDARCCMTAYAPTWEQSILLLIFKHEILAQENWGGFRPRTGRFDVIG